METFDAVVIEKENKYYINITDSKDNLITEIPISEDEPNIVKSAYNKLILRLKKGMFVIKMINPGNDLYSQISNEYISQLNREIEEVFLEMQHYNLLDNDETT